MTFDSNHEQYTAHRGLIYASKGRIRALSAILLVLSLTLVAACDFSPTPTPVPTALPTPDPLVKALGELTVATAVNIRDDWSGLSLANPVLAHYRLERGSTGLIGTAEFQAGSQPITATEAVSVPSDVATSFFQKLASAPLKKGDYTPKIEHTDDYPNISITIPVPSGTISFYSQSQGDDHTPWGANIGNNVYTIDAPTVAEALALLEPHLKKDVLERVVNDASKR